MEKLIKHYIEELFASGLTGGEIVYLLQNNSGIRTTESNISRLRNGKYKNTNYELGAAIVQLHKQICAKKGRKK